MHLIFPHRIFFALILLIATAPFVGHSPAQAQSNGWTVEPVGRGRNVHLTVFNNRPAIAAQSGSILYHANTGSSWREYIVQRDVDNGPDYLALGATTLNGLPAFTYHPDGQNELLYAEYDGQRLIRQTISDNLFGSVGKSAPLVEYNGRAATAYIDYVAPWPQLMFAYKDSNGDWVEQLVQGQSLADDPIALAIVNGQPVIAFMALDSTFDDDLFVARYDGNTWQIEAVDDSDVTSPILDIAIAEVNGQAAIAYIEQDNYDPETGGSEYLAEESRVQYALDTGNGWQIETVQAIPQDFDTFGPSTISMAVVAGQPAVAFNTRDSSAPEIRYARYTGFSWFVQQVTFAGTSSISLADLNGKPGIAFDGAYYATLPNPDYTPPQLTTSTPANNADDVVSTTDISLTFSERVRIRQTGFSFLCQPGNVSVLGRISSSGNTYTLNPRNDLPAGADCTLTLPLSSIKDTSENQLIDPDGTDDGQFTLNFRVNTPPQVVSTSPFNWEDNVAQDANLVVTFSERVKIQKDGVRFICSGSPVRGRLSISGNVYTYTPNELFTAGGLCTLTMETAKVTDLTGAALVDTDSNVDDTYRLDFVVEIPVESAVVDNTEAPAPDTETMQEIAIPGTE